MTTKRPRRAPVAGRMRKTYAAREGGDSVRWWATNADLARLERLKKRFEEGRIMKPSSALVIRAALMLMEHNTELAAIATRAL